MGGEYSTNGDKRNAHRLLMEKPEGKRQPGRQKCKLVDSIKMDLEEIG
jgi:hypothetical protein